jgi:hypothetical protein
MFKSSEFLERYNFSVCAKRIVFVHAPIIAQRFGDDQIDPLHILMAVTEEKATKSRGTDYETLLRLQGSSRDKLRKAAKAELGRYATEVSEDDVLYSSDTDALLRLAFAETDRSDTIHTVHLLAGILNLKEDDKAYKVLHGQGMRVVKTRVLIGVH